MLAIPGDRIIGDDRGRAPSNTGRPGSNGVAGRASLCSSGAKSASDLLGVHEYENKGRRAYFDCVLTRSSSSSSRTQTFRFRLPDSCRGGVNSEIGWVGGGVQGREVWEGEDIF
jgi:hypothetical protein